MRTIPGPPSSDGASLSPTAIIEPFAFIPALTWATPV
uniref:Uncharacterized protein n=1 Tax=viral metagenome TaxID=1070528 RepID=A0A6C0L250_9ZZZZ